MSNTKRIVNTQTVIVEERDHVYVVFIKMAGGGWLEHMPFTRNPQGLIGAMQLATNCLAGLFYPNKPVLDEQFKIEATLLSITNDANNK